MAYRVEEILTVEPEETEALEIIPGKDYVTLVTCTPYGINSHRLLVRGERILWEEKEEKTKEKITHGIWQWMKILFVVSAVVILAAGILLIVIPFMKKRRGGD